MRRRAALEIFSLSFLDLICCAMAGVLVLFVIADAPAKRADSENQSPEDLSKITFVEVEFADKDGQLGEIAFAVELQMEKPVESILGNSVTRNSRWAFTTNPNRGHLELRKPLRSSSQLRIVLFDFDPRKAPMSAVLVRVRVISPSNSDRQPTDVTLDESNSFECTVPL